MRKTDMSTYPRPGQRVQINEHSPWPERVGCKGIVVAPPADGTYPQPAKDEVIVRLDADPLTADIDTAHKERWTCVIDRKSVEGLVW